MVDAPKAAGGFLGGILNNPGAVILGGLVIALVFFKDDISRFFGKAFGEAAISGTGEAISGAFEGAGTAIGEAFGGLGESITDLFAGFKLPEITLPEIDLPTITDIFQPRDGGDFTDVGMAAARGRQDQPTPEVIPISIPGEQIQTELETGQQFFGFGPSFEGGVIRETPTEFLSLSQIIDKFMVTASQAASIRAEAQGFTPQEQAFLSQGPVDVEGFVSGGPPAVSDSMFEGLTATEIVRRLTGGIISNF